MWGKAAGARLFAGVLAVAFAGVVLSAGTPAVGQDSGAASFVDFCRTWMEKLAARERDNLSQIKWRRAGSGFEGEYVGYSKDHRCEWKPGQVPIGKLSYQEVRYRKRGESIAAAKASAPEIVEVTEVTEIFRYQDGKWVY